MELALSLGGDAQKPFPFFDKSHKTVSKDHLGFCMALDQQINNGRPEIREILGDRRRSSDSSSNPPIQLDLLPFSPVPRTYPNPPSHLTFPWLTSQNLTSEPGKGPTMSRQPSVVDEETETLSSPNSTVSSFQTEFGMYTSRKRKRDAAGNEVETERASSRGSDEEEINGLARKKLRLTKDQSAFLEESFKKHNTLNPKQKLTVAKQLNLRPRQVEVWFQNRRARTKLKQTEVDCEYLKRCCETLTEENRRLHKELQELKALKSSQPFYRQLPATTLTMCPSCERVATTTTTTSAAAAATTNTTLSLSNPVLVPNLQTQVHSRQSSS